MSESLSDLQVRNPLKAALATFGLIFRVVFFTVFPAVTGYGFLFAFGAAALGDLHLPWSELAIAGGVTVPGPLVTFIASAILGGIAYYPVVLMFRIAASNSWSDFTPLLFILSCAPAVFGGLLTIVRLVEPFADAWWSLASTAAIAAIMSFTAFRLTQWQKGRQSKNSYATLYLKNFWVLLLSTVAIVAIGSWFGGPGLQRLIVAIPALVALIVAQILILTAGELAVQSVKDYGHSVSVPSAVFLLVGIPAMVLFSVWAGGLPEHGRSINSQSSLAALVTVAVLGIVVAQRSMRRRDAYRSKQHQPANGSKNFRIKGDKEKHGEVRLPRWLSRFGYWLTTLFRKIRREIVFAGRYLLDLIRLPVSVIDHVLAVSLALVFGATLNGRIKRYFVLTLHVAASLAAIILLPGWWGGIGFVWSTLAVLSLARRWNWIESDRERFLIVKDERPDPKTGVRLGFEQDLGDEVVFAFLAFFGLVLPATIWQADIRFGLFIHQTGTEAGLLDWLMFVGGELLKALPFVDWSEIYGFENARMFEPHPDRGGLHLVFALRVSMDVLLITTLLQALAISQRIARRRQQIENPSDPTFFHDIFEERDLMTRALRDWRVVHELQFYDDDRLVQLLQNGEDPVALAGAARVAGYGLAPKALKLILQPPPSTFTQGKHQFRMLHVALQQVRGAAIDGVRRRSALLRGAINFPATVGFRVVRQKDYTPDLHAKLGAELERMGRVRATSLEVTQAAKAAPAQRDEAAKALKKRKAEDLRIVLGLVSSNDQESAEIAVQGLSLITPGSANHDWITNELMSLANGKILRPHVRAEIMEGIGRLNHVKSQEYLTSVFLDRNEDVKVRLAAMEAAAELRNVNAIELRGHLRDLSNERGGLNRVVGNRISNGATAALTKLALSQQLARAMQLLKA